jgi:uncharacterized SAM-binding protein YcdF (DUF218 family)
LSGGRRRLLPELARLLLAAGLVALIVIAYVAYRIGSQGARDDRRPADAIVVLGAAQYDGRAGAVLEARLQHALELFEEGLAPYLVVTGGKLPGDATTEAEVSRDWLIERGVPSAAILFENRGRTTAESLAAVARLFRDHDLRRGVFVSDRTHMLRVLRIALDEGIEAWGSPTTTSPSDNDPIRYARATIHELAGLAAYYVGARSFAEGE